MKNLIFFFIINLSLPAFAQEEGISAEEKVQQEVNFDSSKAPQPLKFSEEKLEEYRQQAEFDYTEEVSEENWWTMFKRYISLQWQKLMNWLFGDVEATGFWQYIIQAIPYLLIAGFLIFAVWLFGKLNPAASLLSRSQKGKVTLTEEEKIVRDEDIRGLISQAEADENFRLATRYHYLLVLQQLSNKGFIKYIFSKTDEDYLVELESPQIKEQFKKVTRIYDFIWYGNFGVGHEDYEKISREFRKINELTKVNEQAK